MYETRQIAVNINDLMHYDFEQCLDLFESLFFMQKDKNKESGVLSDISYQAVSVKLGTLYINVTGFVEDFSYEYTED